MFMLPGHGTTAVNADRMDAYDGEKVFSDFAACGFTKAEDYPSEPDFGRFAYYFENGAAIPPQALSLIHI